MSAGHYPDGVTVSIVEKTLRTTAGSEGCDFDDDVSGNGNGRVVDTGNDTRPMDCGNRRRRPRIDASHPSRSEGRAAGLRAVFSGPDIVPQHIEIKWFMTRTKMRAQS